MSQISFYDGSQKLTINKPIRLIELFAGYGSQAFALEYLGKNVESWKICEWAVKSIQAYKDAHFSQDTTDYSKDLSIDEIIDYLYKKGISQDYNSPMTLEQIKRLGNKARQIYNNIKATNNLVNIQQVKGQDLEIKDTDKYCYIMTYSFPCQDLSSAGLGKGMAKGSGTRSGMLWEVERILDELMVQEGANHLPQILLMENVPEVIGTNNIRHFAKWLEKLESLGYHCYWQVLNAKDYGIPQNRERCFMVSVLGDYYYNFPESIKLKYRLKDLLEDEVDEKFYLSDKAINDTLNTTFNCSQLENRVAKDGLSPTVTTCGDENREPKILEENLKSKLCNDLIANGKVRENDVIRHSYSNSRMNGEMKDIQQNNISPTLDTRCDCLGVVVDDSVKPSVAINFEREKGKIINSDKDIYQCNCDSAWQDNKVGLKISPTLRAGNECTFALTKNLRIRKLTPKECFRLMGVKDEDFEKIAKNQSNASLYHLAGDSIVVNVLMEIFRNMF